MKSASYRFCNGVRSEEAADLQVLPSPQIYPFQSLHGCSLIEEYLIITAGVIREDELFDSLR
jgi:hypothetical protein